MRTYRYTGGYSVLEIRKEPRSRNSDFESDSESLDNLGKSTLHLSVYISSSIKSRQEFSKEFLDKNQTEKRITAYHHQIFIRNRAINCIDQSVAMI